MKFLVTILLLCAVFSIESAKNYACDILKFERQGKLDLWTRHASGVSDSATAKDNVQDTCDGRTAALSKYTCRECRNPGAPGGRVQISRSVLKFIYDVANSGQYLHVNEIAGACHSCNSRHYRGLAVDVHKSGNYNLERTLKEKCQQGGGKFIPETRHYHCQF